MEETYHLEAPECSAPGPRDLGTSGRAWRLALLLTALCLLLQDTAAGVVTGAIRPGFNAAVMPKADDDSTSLVPIGFEVNFFNQLFSQLYVNKNGNVTFGQSLSEYTPFPITTTNRSIIAAFFADVDTSNPSSGDAKYSTGGDTVDGHLAFGATWVDVGYFGSKIDKLNSFQLILIERADTGAGNFDIEFNYEKIQWETGDASGGVGGLGGASARVGYANGVDQANTFELRGSDVDGAFLDSNLTTGLIYGSLRSQVPGRYIFQVRNGVVTDNPPVANAGPDISTNPGTDLTLDGSASYDPENQPITYSWVQLAGPAVSLSNPAAAQPTFTAPSSSVPLTFELTVSDGALSSADQVTVFVEAVPEVVTGAATDVTMTTATLNGTVNASGTAASVFFEYGLTAEYGSSTPAVAVAAGASDVPASASLIDLALGTEYHYRIVATNGIGTAQGDDRSFVTQSAQQPGGTFSSLLADKDGHTGTATLRLNTSGSFSATISLTGIGRFTLRGVVDGGQQFSLTLPGGLMLVGKLVNETIRIVVTKGTNEYEGTLVRLARGRARAGNYTMLLPIAPAFASDDAVPHGTGFAVVLVDGSGRVRAVGSTGDGAKFGTGSGLRADGTSPFFAGIYAGRKGQINGTLFFRDRAESVFDGVLAWSKPKDLTDPFYGSGFTASLNAIGSRYARPSKQTEVLQLGAAKSVTVAFTEGNLGAPLSGIATIPVTGEAAVSRALRSLAIFKSSGLFNGYFVHADGLSKFYQGVVFQKQQRGAGFFLGNDRAGAVTLTP